MDFENQNNFSNQPDIQTVPPQEPKRNFRAKPFLIGLALILVLIGVFRIGYNFGVQGYVFSPKEFKVVNKTGANVTVDYNLLWQALDVVNRKYIERDQIDQQKVLYGAISGAVKAAGDEYTDFFDPETLAQFKTELQGSFSGIGAEIGKKDGNIVIVAPIEGTPAEKAGLRAKDIIVKVNDESTYEWPTDKAAEKIRGEAGTTVKLNIFREGASAPFDVTITRDKIEIKSVKLEYKEVNGKTVAVLHLTRFGDDTQRLFDNVVAEVKQKNVAGLIVDLRNNPGGYLDTAVDIASDWLPAGTLVVSEARSDSDVLKYTSNGTNRLGNLKTVVLINGGSASAAEILSGALKDNGKAILIGEKSFGKGSVQELIPLTGDTALKVTVAKWITPSGKNLNHDGLVPDVEIKLTDTDIDNNRDPQLDTALQEVTK